MSEAKLIREPSATNASFAELTPTPNVPIHTADLPWEEWREGVRFGSRDQALSRFGGATQIGVTLVSLAPGQQSCPFHYHMREEEHFYVLRGHCVLRSGETRHEVTAGDYACFPAGTRVAHCFENPFTAPCEILMIGNRHADEITVYPDSQKMTLRALGLTVPLPAASLDYWTSEPVTEPVPRKEP